MKTALFIVSTTILAAISTVPVFASSTPNLQVQIFPLECHLDNTALGTVDLLQLTPENCLPKPPEMPVILPPSSQDNFFNTSDRQTFLEPIFRAPQSNVLIPDIGAPLVVDPGETKQEKTADQIQVSTIVTSVILLLIAALLAVIHALYTGVIVPFFAEKNILKHRSPRSKK